MQVTTQDASKQLSHIPSCAVVLRFPCHRQPTKKGQYPVLLAASNGLCLIAGIAVAWAIPTFNF